MLYPKPSSLYSQIYNHFGSSPGGLYVKGTYYIPAKNIGADGLDDFLSLCWCLPILYGGVNAIKLVNEKEWNNLVGITS